MKTLKLAKVVQINANLTNSTLITNFECEVSIVVCKLLDLDVKTDYLEIFELLKHIFY